MPIYKCRHYKQNHFIRIYTNLTEGQTFSLLILVTPVNAIRAEIHLKELHNGHELVSNSSITDYIIHIEKYKQLE